MRTRQSVYVLWLVTLAVFAFGGCREKKAPDTLAGPLPVQQPGEVPAPVQTDSPTPGQSTPAPAPADASATQAEKDPAAPPQSPTPPVPAPAKPDAKPSAPAAPPARPAPAPESKKPNPAPSKQPPASAPSAAASGQQPSAPAAAPAEPKPTGTVVIGTIQIVSNVPDPSTVPYDTCVTFIKYRVSTVLSGSYDGDELLAVFWGMKAGKLQPAARFTAGQSHRLTIEPFDEQKDLARVMQADDTNEYALTPYWVTAHSDE